VKTQNHLYVSLDSGYRVVRTEHTFFTYSAVLRN